MTTSLIVTYKFEVVDQVTSLLRTETDQASDLVRVTRVDNVKKMLGARRGRALIVTREDGLGSKRLSLS